MRKTYFTLTFIFLFISSCFLVNAQQYGENEKLGLKSFLRQPSAVDNKINLQILGLSISDTLNWDVSEDWLVKLHQPQSLTYFDWEWDSYAPCQLKRLEIKTFDDSNAQLSGTLDCSYFSRLEYLDCSNSDLTHLKISENTSLRYLDCSGNKLNDLDIFRLTLLATLNCSNNKISDLDLSNNLNISTLNCAGNQLEDLDLTYNYAIISLICSGNKIENLVLSKISNYIEVLDCSDNLLSNLDISSFSGLKLLAFDNNRLRNIDLANNDRIESLYNSGNELSNVDVSQSNNLMLLNASDNKLDNLNVDDNSQLRYIYAAKNQIQDLDLSSNQQLAVLKVNNNKLEDLDLSNNLSLTDLDCSFNNLYSINTAVSASPLLSVVYNNNNLLFSAMPINYISSGVTKTLKYAPQNELDGGEISYTDVIDLSSEYKIKDFITLYNWSLLPETYTPVVNDLGNGRFSAILNEDNLYICNLTNPFFSDLTLQYKIMIKKDTIVGIEDKSISDNYIYYDKKSDIIIVKTINGDEVKSIELYDTLGRNTVHSEGSSEVSVHNIQSGVYIVKAVFVSGKYISKKIIF